MPIVAPVKTRESLALVSQNSKKDSGQIKLKEEELKAKLAQSLVKRSSGRIQIASP